MTEIIDSRRNSLSYHNKIDFKIKNFLTPKSNYTNSLAKFYSEDVELVKKLDYLEFYKNESTDLKMNSLLLPGIETIMNKKPIQRNLSNKSIFLSKSESNPELPKIKNSLNYKLSELENKNNIIENSVTLKRIENLSNENRLEKEKNQLLDQMNIIKIEMKKITSQLLHYQRDIEKAEMEIVFLENFAKYSERGSNTAKKFDNLKQKKTTTDDLNKFHLAVTQVQKDMDLRDTNKNSLVAEIERKREMKISMKIRLQELKEKNEKFRLRFNEIKNTLILHYHNLLKEGSDSRHEGLNWVIKAIWNLGCNVIISYMPNFLDEKAIEFLFEASHRDVELQKFKIIIDEMKVQMKLALNNRKSLKKNKRTTQFFKTDFKNSPLDKKGHSEMLSTQRFMAEVLDKPNQGKDKIGIKTIEEYLNNKEKIEEEAITLVKKISEMESIYEKNRRECIQLKRNELNRISREFLVNDYERRFNVSQRLVCSAIGGEDNINNEMLRQNRDQKEYFDNMKQVRYFNPFQDNKNAPGMKIK